MEQATAIAEQTAVLRAYATQVAYNHANPSASAVLLDKDVGWIAGVLGWSFFGFLVWRGWRFIAWLLKSMLGWAMARRQAMGM